MSAPDQPAIRGARRSLARVTLARPPLALLDEPPASLDPRAANAVIEEIASFARGRTVVVATHDGRLLARCDAVWRLAGGRLA